MVNTAPRPLYPRKKDQTSIVHEEGWDAESVWKGAENPSPTGIRSLYRSASRELCICGGKVYLQNTDRRLKKFCTGHTDTSLF